MEKELGIFSGNHIGNLRQLPENVHRMLHKRLEDLGYNPTTLQSFLGTSLSQQHKEHLKQFSTVIIALDPDASYKSFSIMKELRSYVNEVLVLKLEDDLKYKRDNDLTKLKELINGTIVN